VIASLFHDADFCSVNFSIVKTNSNFSTEETPTKDTGFLSSDGKLSSYDKKLLSLVRGFPSKDREFLSLDRLLVSKDRNLLSKDTNLLSHDRKAKTFEFIQKSIFRC